VAAVVPIDAPVGLLPPYMYVPKKAARKQHGFFRFSQDYKHAHAF
jgi:hypothetical protein